MTKDAEQADRHEAVRKQARAWRAAGAIDARTLATIEADCPDDRHRLGPGLRVLVAVFTFVAVNALLGIFAVGSNGHGLEALLVVMGIALVAISEAQIGALKRRQAGAEAATTLLGLVYSVVGIGLLSDKATAALLALLVLSAGAAWRWGYWLAATAATVALFGLLARAPGGRWLWVVAGLALPPLLFRAADSARLPPALRACLRAAALVSLLGLYFAFHISSWDHGIVEDIGGFPRGETPDGGLRSVFIAGTALVPLGVLIAGLRARRSELLALGVLLGLASSITLRYYVHVAPLWVILTAGGLAGIALGLGLLRFLRGGKDRERGGFSAEPLYGRASGGLVEIAAALASFSPAPQAASAQAGLKPGGGRYGGGGASGTY